MKNFYPAIRIPLLLFLIVCIQFQISAQITGDLLLRNAYETYNSMRVSSTGLYRDKLIFNGNWDDMGSTASIGAGFISLAVAAKAGYLSHNDAVDSALVSLRALNGENPLLTQLDRNVYGFFKHFPNVHDGSSGSEYSTIDNSILMAGILICKNYFVQIEPELLTEDRKKELIDQTNTLWNSIHWTKIVRASEEPGHLGIVGTFTESGEIGHDFLPYSEYILVPWLAIHDFDGDNYDMAVKLWEDYYAVPRPVADGEFGMKANSYGGYAVLSDRNSFGVEPFLPSFIHLFNYYYIHPYRKSEIYMMYHHNSYKADKAWWDFNYPGRRTYEWGCGAGGSSSGYKVNAIDRNSDGIASPAILAGYIPVGGASISDLIAMYNEDIGVYTLPKKSTDEPDRKILWRYVVGENSVKTTTVEGVDFSTMLYGLAESVIDFDFNDLTRRFGHVIPGRIDAEDYLDMYGVKGGKTIGSLDNSDWMEYSVYVKESKSYTLYAKASAVSDTSVLEIRSGSDVLAEMSLKKTNHTDSFTIQSTEISLSKGPQQLRLYAKKGGFKLDFIELPVNGIMAGKESFAAYCTDGIKADIFPNPVTENHLSINLRSAAEESRIIIYSDSGKTVWHKTVKGNALTQLSTCSFGNPGLYIVRIISGDRNLCKKLIIE